MEQSMDEVQLYSLQEVKEHKTKDSAWCVYENNVYDVTNYLEDHPGGGDLVLDECGGDMTKPFDDTGHSDTARQILKKYKIGELRPEDRIDNQNTSRKSCCVII